MAKGSSTEWARATEAVVHQLTPEQLAQITDEGIWNLVDMDPGGLAAGRSLQDVLLDEVLARMEELGVPARRAAAA